ncbi:MAG TPA: twin-arginine translocase subunit TatC [Vicinamibacterales bacterium]|nr:twin-arginine translocase subunit TatC [Vicinamibacterales bacterium]
MALVPFPSSSPAHRDPDDEEPLDTEDELDGAGGKMSFLEHLDELRRRLIVSVYALIGGCVISFIFVQRLENFIYAPLVQLMPGNQPLIYTAPMEAFMNMMKVGALGGLFLALPVIVLQLWLFIAPGLYANEKRFAVPFVLLGTFFFIAGAAFSHYIAFPYTWRFFLGFENEYLKFMPKLSDVFSLWIKMLLGFGVIFQMPTIVFFLARMGLVTAGFLIKHTKYAILIIFILGAVLSPGTDVVSQAMMAGPMLVLYALSIGIAFVFAKRKNAEED